MLDLDLQLERSCPPHTDPPCELFRHGNAAVHPGRAGHRNHKGFAIREVPVANRIFQSEIDFVEVLFALAHREEELVDFGA